MVQRYLTKSRFKLAVECPKKLFYTKKHEYPDQKDEDSFLEALMEGGFQVGELAKFYFPEGYEVESLNYSEALQQTNDLLKKSSVSIFEAAINVGNFFIRVDVLNKKDNNLELIEVKSKSYRKGDESKFHTSVWKEYLYDVAFQKYVLQKAFPENSVSAHLMLVDKDKPCSVDGLFGKFKINRDENNRKIVTISSSLSEDDKNVDILTKVCVDSHVNSIINGPGLVDSQKTFQNEINLFSEKYKMDELIDFNLGKKCKKCEFRCTEEQKRKDFKDGFRECWKEKAGFTEKDFHDQTVLELQNYRKIDQVIQERKFKLKDLSKEDINLLNPTGKRQWTQIEKEKSDEKTSWVDIDSLKSKMDEWRFPLHFIDFETSKPAIPFTKGKKPYEEIAFQFSHHVVNESGRIEHKDQYINTKISFFPNFEFLRTLKKALEKDTGTIFRYWDHENTYLDKIKCQLENSSEPDKEELIGFIQSITVGGQRSMVDLGRHVIVKYYYSTLMRGSNSIKKVLPAILNESIFLKNKYSKPIYGSNEIKSLNFKKKTWIQIQNQNVIDPYKLLDRDISFLSDIDPEKIENFTEARFNNIAKGGEAMMAYHYLQSPDIDEDERGKIETSLLKYCELDTFAMVMIYEYFKSLLS